MSLTLLIVGSSGMISILLPYAAESYPPGVRGRATGWVAGWSKIGGLIAQGLSAFALVPRSGLCGGGRRAHGGRLTGAGRDLWSRDARTGSSRA